MITIGSTGRPARRAAVRGAMAGAGLVPAVIPLGVALGVALAETSAPPLLAWLTAPLLIAGASQLVLVTHLDAGATVVVAVLATTLVNARFVVYGAALAHRFTAQPSWFRWLGPWFVVDQSYALVTAAHASGQLSERAAPDEFRRFYLGAAGLLSLVWSASVGAGVALGPVLPPSLPLEFVLPAMFIALVVPGLGSRTEVAAAAAGAAAAVLTTSSTGALFVGAALGAAIGGPWRREDRP